MEGVKMRAHSATLNGGVGRYLGGEAETNDRTSQEKSKQEYVKYPQTIYYHTMEHCSSGRIYHR